MQQKTFENQGREIPQLGSNIFLDFKNVTKFDLSNQEKVKALLREALEKLNVVPQQFESNKEQLQNGATSINQLALFEHGYASVHTFPETRECNIDFYHAKLQTHEEKLEGLKLFEVFLCDSLGWETATQVFVVPRGHTTRLYFNETSNKSEMMQEVDFVARESSEKNDIRVYRSRIRGLILIINNVLIYSDEIKKSFNVDMTKNLLKKNQKYTNLLILGGFDLSLANYLLQQYEDIENITLVWDDEKILSTARTHFDFAQQASQSSKIKIVVSEPSLFLKQNTAKFDAVLIDAPTSWAADYADPSLTNFKFYSTLSQALLPGAGLSQLFGYQENISNILSDLKEVGFSDTSFVTKSKTASYSEEVLIATIFKQPVHE